MTTSKQEFVEAVDEIFEEFAEFIVNVSFSTDSSYDPVEGANSGGSSFSIESIPMEYEVHQIDGEKIRSGDRNLVSKVSSWVSESREPNVNEMTCTFDSSVWNIISFIKDPADAGYFLQVRRR